VTVRETFARLAGLCALALGVFGIGLAWAGPLRMANGDLGVVLAASGALVVAVMAARTAGKRAVAVRALAASAVVGGAVGAMVMGAPHGPVAGWFVASGVLVWLFASTARAACALPLMWLVRRDAPVASLDALDRTMLASTLWLLAALTEAALVVRNTRNFFTGFAGPALGVALLSLLVLTGLMGFAALVRNLRWLGLWRRVVRGDGWRVAQVSTWSGPVPDEAWFEGLGESDGVVVRTVARDGRAYRDGDLEVAHGRVPRAVGRVTRGLAKRAAMAFALLVALAAAAVVLVAPLRW
jgi:hypothetical protein